MSNIYSISLDIRDNNIFTPILSLSQNDCGSKIQFKITSDGEKFDISEVVGVFQMFKGGTNIIKICSNLNGILELSISDNMTDIYGKFPYQICLISEDVKITTVTNYIKIRKDGD